MTPDQAFLVTLAIIGGAYVLFRYLMDRFFPSVFGAPSEARIAIPPAGRDPFDIGKFPYAYRDVAGVDAFAEWEMAKTEGKGVPLIVGGEDGLLRLAEEWFRNGGATVKPQDILAAADRNPDPLDVTPWDKPEGPSNWPAPETVVSSEGPTVHLSLHRKPLPRVHIVYLPARDSTEIPAWLNLGGWNDCPDAAVQVAMLRKWRDAYGAELVGVSHDTMDIRVKRRPHTREEALRLVGELAEFCSDLTEDSVEQQEKIAAELMASDWWFFWWD